MIKRLLMLLISVYQRLISPVLPRSCRFQPTCSEYAREALESHGILRGLYLAVRRLLTCHPWSPRHPWDPVPEDPPF